MFSGFDINTRQMLLGNILLILCCAFYLAWWIAAFKPVGAVKGMKSGWLLIPAFVFGIAAIIEIVRGSSGEAIQTVLIPKVWILLGGVVIYVVLLIVTSMLMKRQVTTELLLIVGWTVLTYLELDALYGLGHYSGRAAIALLVIAAAAAVIGLVCYLLYYNLDSMKGYIDGMIPLLLVAVMMVVITIGVIMGSRT